MTSKDLWLLFLGAVLGALVNSLYDRGRAAFSVLSRRRALSRRLHKNGAGILARRLVELYQKAGWDRSLYHPKMLGSGKPVAFLWSQDIVTERATDVHSDDPFFLCDDWSPLAFRKTLIKRYERQGVHLFDGETLRVESAIIGPDGELTVRVVRSNYFAFADLSWRLRRDLVSPWRRHGLHSAHLQSVETALADPPSPMVVGMTVATIFQSVDGPVITLARRSNEVLSNPSEFALLPTFGLEANAIEDKRSKYGLTFYNFCREFCEELFDLEELIHSYRSRRADPDWFFQLPPAAALLREFQAGRLTLTDVGIGVNPIDGSLMVAIVAHFTSADFLEWVKSEARVNWESTSSLEGRAPVRFIGLEDPALDRLTEDGLLASPSVYAIDLARAYGRETCERREM